MKSSILRACIVALSMAACAFASAAAPPISADHQLAMAHAQVAGAESQHVTVAQVAIVAFKAESPAVTLAPTVTERMCPAAGSAATMTAYTDLTGSNAERQVTARHSASAGARHLV